MTSRLRDTTDTFDDCCLRSEPGLDELLADEIMEPILRSAQVDREQLCRQLFELALRIRDGG